MDYAFFPEALYLEMPALQRQVALHDNSRAHVLLLPLSPPCQTTIEHAIFRMEIRPAGYPDIRSPPDKLWLDRYLDSTALPNVTEICQIARSSPSNDTLAPSRLDSSGLVHQGDQDHA